MDGRLFLAAVVALAGCTSTDDGPGLAGNESTGPPEPSESDEPRTDRDPLDELPPCRDETGLPSPPEPGAEPLPLPPPDQVLVVHAAMGGEPFGNGGMTVVYGNGSLVHLATKEALPPRPYWPYDCPPGLPDPQARRVLRELNATPGFNGSLYGWLPALATGSPDPDGHGYFITHSSRVQLSDAQMLSLRAAVADAGFPSLNRTYCCPTWSDATPSETTAWVDGQYWNVDIIGPAPERLWRVGLWLWSFPHH